MELGIIYQELEREAVGPARLDDINRLLPQLLSPAEPCTSEWLVCMFSSGARLFGAFDGNKLVGMGVLASVVTLTGRKYWIEDIVVDEAYRRQKIGSRLMDMMERVSRVRGAESITLTSRLDRSGAREMYGRRGYELQEIGVFRLTLSSD